MKRRRSLLDILHLACLSLAGVAGAHVLAYLVGHPSAHERATRLAGSGHGYLDVGVLVAATLGCAALLHQLWTSVRGTTGAKGAGSKLPSLWVLALLQLGLFSTIELVERLDAGGLPQLLSEPAFWIGLPMQVVVALCARLLLRAVQVVGESIKRRRTPRATPTIAPLHSSTPVEAPRYCGFNSTFSPRGPPLAA